MDKSCGLGAIEGSDTDLRWGERTGCFLDALDGTTTPSPWPRRVPPCCLFSRNEDDLARQQIASCRQLSEKVGVSTGRALQRRVRQDRGMMMQLFGQWREVRAV
ncbi:hypothetical protein AB4212_52330, partial [Streptomyces sp. 2MCAF27]